MYRLSNTGSNYSCVIYGNDDRRERVSVDRRRRKMFISDNLHHINRRADCRFVPNQLGTRRVRLATTDQSIPAFLYRTPKTMESVSSVQ